MHGELVSQHTGFNRINLVPDAKWDGTDTGDQVIMLR